MKKEHLTVVERSLLEMYTQGRIAWVELSNQLSSLGYPEERLVQLEEVLEDFTN